MLIDTATYCDRNDIVGFEDVFNTQLFNLAQNTVIIVTAVIRVIEAPH